MREQGFVSRFHRAVELIGRRRTGAIIQVLLAIPARKKRVKDGFPVVAMVLCPKASETVLRSVPLASISARKRSAEVFSIFSTGRLRSNESRAPTTVSGEGLAQRTQMQRPHDRARVTREWCP
jgi:hypothetical protein